ncbi:MAG: efflux RND transporter periplasmic adaptor subunit [Culturomica sp.]|jgi:HlyD family secretion protein|nr:efflux RND transporter periplasmic adaptor subunit [Culturomica sp.]
MKAQSKFITFIAIVALLALVVVFGFIFWQPQPEIIQGEAEATEVRISSKVPGRIDKFFANEGDKVKKGDTLVIIDSPEVKAKLAQAKALQTAAQAINRKVDKGSRSEQITMAYETWQKATAASEVMRKSYERVKNLYDNEVVSAQKKDEVEANYKAAVATEKAAKAQYDMALKGAQEEDKQAAAAQVEIAKGALSEVESYLSEINLVATIDGEISERYPKAGELVGTGAPIMDIVDLSDMWVTFNIREDLLGDLAMGKTFNAVVPALGNKNVQLQVNYIKDRGSYAAWRATKTTGQFDRKTFEVRAKPTAPIEGLRPGMTVLLDK